MKPVLWILGVMLLLSSVSSFADSVTVLSNLNANFQIIPNVRAHFEGEIFGPGISVDVTGHMPGGWFSISPHAQNLPGSVASGSTQIFFETASGTVDSDTGYGFAATFSFVDAGSYVFPTNGKNFTINLPATLESIYLSGCGYTGCQALVLNTQPGDLRLSYTYDAFSRLRKN